VGVRQAGEQLVVMVRDNGRGGAVIGAGSGLTGLVSRIRPVSADDLASVLGAAWSAVWSGPLRGRRARRRVCTNGCEGVDGELGTCRDVMSGPYGTFNVSDGPFVTPRMAQTRR
jgi:hypothetical protein